MGKAANSSISLKQIHVTDNFWNKYVHLVKDVIIPYQWDILNDKLEDVETSHCIENFKIAAGEKEGEFQGAVFQDTDVAKWLEAVGFVLNYERDEKLEELADETIELIGRAQQPDGYLNTYFTIKEPDGRWSNLMEGHELYTAGHGKSFFYVNPLEVWPVSCMPRTSREHVKPVRQKWFGVACCPPNITRTLASLGQYIYFQEENEIYVNLYVANETEVTLNGVPFKITLKGNFPWENKMTVSVDGVQETEAMIAFRVPAYAENFKILRNGKEENLTEDHGYIKISGKMYKETFEISFDAEPVFVHANPQVRVDSAKVAVVKGPLVYCVEEADNGENLSSVMVNTDQKIEETYDDELLEGCSVLHITGKKISEKGWNEGILYQNRKVELEDVKLTLVPYCYWGNRENGEMLVWMKELFYM